tara:strand:+ start:23679 stop:24464 length:786 start_codon:yes stop_codon:yes gene_type:complete
MEPSVNNLNSNQPKTLSKREDKKNVNIQWNHQLYFQLGLVVSLLTVFFVMEMNIEYKTAKADTQDDFFLVEPAMTVYTLYTEPTPEVPKPKKQTVAKKTIADVVNEVPDNTVITETKTASTDVPDIVPQIVDEPVKQPVIHETPKNMTTVEFVPVFPGCESLTSNEERKACMSDKISGFVQKKFRTDKFEDLVDAGKQKIYVQFKIDANGSIVDVIARGPHVELENEATRVISDLPQMQPGKQGSTNVAVLYSLPIVFQVN